MKEQKERRGKEKAEPALQVASERSDSFLTDSGILIDRVYLPEEFSYDEKLGLPGEFPFTRGIYPTMYRSRLWTMRQYAGYGSAEESNRRYRFLMSQGSTGLSVAFDLPTQMGYDSDHPLADGEVGRVGVAIDSLVDMEDLFEGIELPTVSTSMTINATAAIILAMYVAVAKRQKADVRSLSGTIQNDILKEYIARGTYIYPPGRSMRLVTDVFEWCGKHLPNWNTISISGYHIREAGATAAQEVAFTLANATAYVEAAVNAGLDIDAFAGRVSFFFSAHSNFFEEVAKFRAARRIWARMMKERFRARDLDSMKLRFHTQTSGARLTAQQIDNNIVRVTLQALAAVMGGTQSLHTNSRDEALALPTLESARLALRTQQIIAYESGVADNVDPLAGSYFLEHLTDEMESQVRDYLERIDEMGGAIEAIGNGFYQNEIAKSAYEYQMAIEKGRKTIVGVGRFVTEEAEEPPILEIDAAIRELQIRKLQELRLTRDRDRFQKALDLLRKAAGGTENLMPAIIDCVQHHATVGEISDALRDVWGEYRP
jgi:methylmalonyl-CoA mutase N-terminal domain/subunit